MLLQRVATTPYQGYLGQVVRVEAGEVVDMADSDAERLQHDYPRDWKRVTPPVAEPQHNTMAEPPKRRRGRPPKVRP